MTRVRVRFTVRTLAIFLTLFCAYFGAWETTKMAAREQLSNVQQEPVTLPTLPSTWLSVHGVSSPLPLLMCQELTAYTYVPDPKRWHLLGHPKERPPYYLVVTRPRRYYVWIFGPKIKLPFESKWQSPEPASVETEFTCANTVSAN